MAIDARALTARGTTLALRVFHAFTAKYIDAGAVKSVSGKNMHGKSARARAIHRDTEVMQRRTSKRCSRSFQDRRCVIGNACFRVDRA